MRIPVFLLFFAALFPTYLFASVPFDSGVSILGINGAVGVVAGDLDGDGIADVAGLGGGRVVYILNNGDATAWTSTNLVSSGPWVRQIELANVDGDTDLDLIYTDFTDDRVYWFRNDLSTSGSFSSRRTVGNTIDGADGLLAVDLDEDLDIDLVATARAGDAYYWFENNDGSGTSWTTHLIANGLDAPQTVTAGDLDGDGDLDLIGGGAEAGGSTIWIENTVGDASEWSVQTIDATAWVNSVAVTDLDLDGDLDVVLQENNAAPPASDADVVLWWENTLGDASAWTEHEIGPAGRDATRGLQVVDLDFDGDPDVVANRDGDWFENTAGNASAWTRHSFSDADEIADTEVRDLDGDGDLDLLGARQERDRIEWWENLTCDLTDPDDDSDGYRNDCDVCDGFDDALDADHDGVPDGCDQCPGEDDRVDVDGEGTPDACQVIASLTIADVAASEGDAGTTDFTFTVTLTGAIPETLTVDYATADGTATSAGGDYSATSGTLSFDGNDGEIETFTVSVTGDTDLEGDETFTVQLSNVSSLFAEIIDDTAIGTIQEDDNALLSIDDVQMLEGDSGAVNFVFTVTLDGENGSPFSVGYATQDGSAEAGSDYTSAAGTLSFDGNDGETETLVVTVQRDTVVEADETFTVVLGTPSGPNVALQDGTGVGTIQNDDSATVSVDDVSVAEGDSGTVDLIFSISLSGDVQDGFTVDANTRDGTATTAGGDYAAVGATLSFDGHDGEIETFTVAANGDDTVEGDETFTVELGSPSDSSITAADGIGVGTLEGDDTASLSIGDVTATEGDAGTIDFIFAVTLDGDVQGGFTVGASTQDGTATAASGDFASTAGTLSFDGTDGETELFTVSIAGDATVEADELFSVLLGTPSNDRVTVIDGTGLGTIQNDDSASIAIDDVSAMEGDSGTTQLLFTVTLTGAVQDGFTVDANTQDGTATAASGDFVTAAGTLSFTGADGETQTVTVDVIGDTVVEADEPFIVELGSPSLAAVTAADNTGIGTIQNDDSAAIAIGDTSATEGDSGTTDLTFTVTLSGDVQDGFTVGANTLDGTASVASGDYAAAVGTLSFAGVDGETQAFTVEVNGETVVETDETLSVELDTPSNADITVSDDTGIGTIQNDDSTSISIGSVSILEGDSGTRDLAFTVSLDGDVQGGFTVSASTQDGSATAASGDYGSTAEVFTFAGSAGETQAFNVTVNGDTTVEADETFIVLLGTPSDAGVTVAGSGLGTIQNDDTASLSIADAGVAEGDSGATELAFTVTLTGAVQDGFTVNAFTQDSSATTSDGDYGAAVDILSFSGSDGETQRMDVDVFGDLRVEPDESFFVLLASPSNSDVGIADGTAIGTIENDDNATLSIADVATAEGDSGTTTFSFEVTLSGTVDSSFLVGYGTRDGSATAAGGDYDSAAGFLSFAGNDGETQIAGISVRGDTDDELDELFFVDLTSSTNPTVTFSTGTAQGTILDDDATLTVIVEGQGHVMSSPIGIDCGDGGLDCQEVYPTGTTVDLTPTPASDWVFLGWSGDADCNDGSITLDDTASCTATFAESGGLLVIDFNGDGFGSVTSTPAGIDCDRADSESGCAALFDVGVDIELTATAAPVDTFFDGWTGDADCEDGLVTFLDDGEMVICVAKLFAIPLFTDGFESGDTSAWTSTAPLVP